MLVGGNIMFEKLQNALKYILSKESPYRPAITAALTILILWVVYKVSTKMLRRYLRRKPLKAENVERFFFAWRYVWVGIGVIFLLVGFSGSFTALGISAAFLGLVLGWSLQAPVTGIAAWLMILVKRPFRIGDRIIISGIIGDVVDITLTHVIVNQAGGTVGGEEKSGRGVLIPNAILFQQIIHNYSFESQYILDEVPVLITYESDLDAAEGICRTAATEVTQDIIKQTGKEAFTRVELADSGIRIHLRYQSVAVERQKIGSEIVRAIVREFNKTDQVEFAYPHTEVLYRPKTDLGITPVASDDIEKKRFQPSQSTGEDIPGGEGAGEP
jgi:small-conductance mechanosensitive channel